MVSARVFRPLIDAAETLGVARASLLEAAQLDIELATPDERLPANRLYALCEAIIDLAGDPAIGLRVVDCLLPRSFAPVADLVYYSTNLRASIVTLQSVSWMLADDLQVELKEEGDTARIQFLPPVDGSSRFQQFASELVVGGMHRRFKTFAPSIDFRRISFGYPAPTHRGEYERLFGTELHFGEAFTGLSFDRAWLTSKSPHADAELHTTLSLYTKRKKRDLDMEVTYTERVRRLVAQLDSPRYAAMNTIASALELSIRSLRRRLLEEGTTFAEIVDDALARAAKSYLVDRGHSIQETAFELGFSDRATFHRAFKRWTGLTPSAFCRDPGSYSGAAEQRFAE